jgi:hypothetical protein
MTTSATVTLMGVVLLVGLVAILIVRVSRRQNSRLRLSHKVSGRVFALGVVFIAVCVAYGLAGVTMAMQPDQSGSATLSPSSSTNK